MMENPYRASILVGEPNEPPLQSIRFVKAWILFFVLSAVAGFGAGAFVGAIAGALMAAMGGMEPRTFMLVCQGLGFLVSLPVSFLIYRWSIRKYILDQVI